MDLKKIVKKITTTLNNDNYSACDKLSDLYDQVDVLRKELGMGNSPWLNYRLKHRPKIKVVDNANDHG